MNQPTTTTSTSYSTSFLLKLFLVIIILGCTISSTVSAQGNLLLMPRRVVFEGAKKYEELNLANTGKDTARYVISLIHVRMKEDGSFIEINEPGPGENFADKYIRFFPKSVTLGPNESQVVKIQLNRNNELAAGEYRSHLYFRAIPKEQPLGETKATNDSSISIKLIPVFGISIPVIVRAGEVNSEVSLSGNHVEMFQDTVPVLNVTFSRKGNISVYGDLAVKYIPDNGKPIDAGNVRGVAVYTPNATRQIRFELNRNKEINYSSGKLHITYSASQEAGGKLIAETDLVLR